MQPDPHLTSSPIAIEPLVDRIVSDSDPDAVARARAEFAARTGSFEPDDAWFEERTRAAFDFALVDWGEPRGVLLQAWAARAPAQDARAARALGRSIRGLFRVERLAEEPSVRLIELLGGASVVLGAESSLVSRLRDGDVFDGRVLLFDGAVRVLPGMVFHPAEAAAAMTEILAAARAAGRTDPRILDGLLRMRMRFDRFTGMHARHVYRWDAIDRTEILAASWARPKS